MIDTMVGVSLPSDHRRLTFSRSMRLSGSSQIKAVYDEKVRASSGPLLIYARPNSVNVSRLGLSVSRRVGNAVVRNRIKRRLREAFRHTQHDLMQSDAGNGYDFVISVRPHEPLTVVEYQQHWLNAVRTVHIAWQKKLNKSRSVEPGA